MSFLQEITKRPWDPAQGAADNLAEGSHFALPTATVALRLFLGVATVIFSLLVIAYSDRMLVPDWRAFPEPLLLWVNTAMLVLSSVALQWAMMNARRNRFDRVKSGLLAGGAYASAFVVGQVLAWQYVAASGYFLQDNPAVAFFYLITALHGLHLLGGIVALLRTGIKVWRQSAKPPRLCLSVELCTVYWHYLLVVWLVVFGLMLFT